MSRKPQINIGLFGFGTVGAKVYELLEKNKELITTKLGYPLQINKICDPDFKKRQGSLPASLFTTKASEILDDPEISIVVELIGDKLVAKEIMLKAMELGKHVVTANKAILAAHGPELYGKASQHEVEILFEAAVAGSIPILRSIREAFIADRIVSILGIINGTSNFILTGMAEKGLSFAEVLAEAQKLGYAEANPSADVEGMDTANKLAILTTMAYGQFVGLDKIYTEGITAITPFDIGMADKFGYTIKLLAISKKTDHEVEARVHPTMIPKEHMMASVKGAFNAVMLEGEAFGPSMLYGLGAGGLPTATAVVGDIVQVSRSIALRIAGVPPLGVPVQNIPKAKVKPMEEIETEYYLRFNTLDKPGVFAKLATVLGQNHISISAVYQHGREEGKEVPIVVITHRAKEKNIQTAIREIDKLNVITQKTLLLRIESK